MNERTVLLSLVVGVRPFVPSLIDAFAGGRQRLLLDRRKCCCEVFERCLIAVERDV